VQRRTRARRQLAPRSDRLVAVRPEYSVLPGPSDAGQALTDFVPEAVGGSGVRPPIRSTTPEAQLSPQSGTDGDQPCLSRLGLRTEQDEPRGLASLVVANLRPLQAQQAGYRAATINGRSWASACFSNPASSPGSSRRALAPSTVASIFTTATWPRRKGVSARCPSATAQPKRCRRRERSRLIPTSLPFAPGRMPPDAICTRRHVRTASISALVIASIGLVSNRIV
jgi:hypothetical protein